MTRDRGRKAARQGFVSGPPSLLPFLLLGGGGGGPEPYERVPFIVIISLL